MAKELPIVHKAFLATKNVESNFFLLTERAEKPDSDSFVFFIIETKKEKIGQAIQHQINLDLIKKFLSSDYFSLSQLEETLQTINKNLSNQSLFSSSVDSVNVIIGFCEQNVLHLTMTGMMEGYLLRKGKINSLTDGLSTNHEFGFYNITSGELNSQDLVIIGNKNLFDRLSLDRIRRTLSNYPPVLAIRDFFQILKKSKTFDCNAIVMQSSQGQNNEKEEEHASNFIYLDEIEETRIQKIRKIISPMAKKLQNSTSSVYSSLKNTTNKIYSKGAQNWREKYQPKTQEIFSQTNGITRQGLGKLSSNVSNKFKDYRSGVKVKPYNKSKTKDSPKLKVLISTFNKLFQAILSKENRRYLYIALVILLIAISYAKIVSNNKNRDAIKQQNDSVYSVDKASEIFQSAKEDILLGRSDGIDKLNEALVLANTGAESVATRDKSLAIKKEIQDKLDEISKMQRIYGAKPIFSFKNSIFVSALSGSTVYGITSDGKIYSTDARDKDPRLVGAIDTALGSPVSAMYSDSANVLYVLTNKPTVWAYDPQSQSGVEILITDGSPWEIGTSIAVYSTNIYLLEPIAGKIWKHGQESSSFSKGTTYSTSKNIDALGGTSISVDGSVYVLKLDGTVVKFNHGTVDSSFTLAKPPKPTETISQATQIFSDADSQNIFILDKSQNRIIKSAKDGIFISQYTIDSKKIDNFLVNPRVQKMWIICDKDVYELDI